MSALACRRAAVIVVWAGVFAAWQVHLAANDVGALTAAQRLIDRLDTVWWGPAVFAVAYLLRPLVLAPASLLTVAAGLLFGPVWGVLLVIVVANASAMLAYAIGRALVGTDPGEHTDGDRLVRRWGDRMRRRSFETVFVMRLLFVPYDLVNYASGALRIRWAPFLGATAIGTLPGTLSFVLLGASIERLDEGIAGVDGWTFAAGLVLFALSLTVARIVRGRTDRAAPPTPTHEEHRWRHSTPPTPTAPSSSEPAQQD